MLSINVLFDTLEKDKKREEYLFDSHGYELIDKVGEGFNCSIMKARSILTGAMVAIKQKDIKPKSAWAEEVCIMKELTELNHENILPLLDYYYSIKSKTCEPIINMVLPLYKQNLRDIIYGPSNIKDFFIQRFNLTVMNHLSRREIKIYLYQVAKALKILHFNRIIHGDLHVGNVLVNDLFDVKLSDFGMSFRLTDQVQNHFYAKGICAPFLSPPEYMFLGEFIDAGIDMWAYGLMLVELINGLPLVWGVRSSYNAIKIVSILGSPTEQDFIDMRCPADAAVMSNFQAKPWHSILNAYSPLMCSPDIAEATTVFVSSLLCYSPVKRLTADQVLKHSFFNEVKQELTEKNVYIEG